MTKAIVLLSGGQDSATCLFWAKKIFDEVVAIGVDYGQKHRQELAQAKIIADIAGVEYVVFPAAGLLGGSSLTVHTRDHNQQHQMASELPASFTAARNALFLTVAAGFGFNNGIEDIVTGVCQTDYSGYPDCRDVFVKSMQASLSLALDKPVRIHTPLMYLTKAETFKLAKELGCLQIVLELTMTDYNGDATMNEWGMGNENNPASALRAKGYREAKAMGWI